MTTIFNKETPSHHLALPYFNKEKLLQVLTKTLPVNPRNTRELCGKFPADTKTDTERNFEDDVPCGGRSITVSHLPPPLALLSGGEAAGVGVAIHGQVWSVTPEDVRLCGGSEQGQVLLCNGEVRGQSEDNRLININMSCSGG